MNSDQASEDYLAGDLEGKLFTYIEAIQTGTKPVACCGILKKQASSAIELILRENLHFLVLPWTEDRVIIYLFQDMYLGEIVLTLDALNGVLDKQFTTWAWGKLYGYGDSDIADYLKKMGLLTLSPLGT